VRLIFLSVLCVSLALAGCRKASGRESPDSDTPILADGPGPDSQTPTPGGASEVPPRTGGKTPEATLVARGVEVYKEQGCGVCHALTQAGTGGMFGPPHDGIGERAKSRIHDPAYHGHATTAEEYLRESVLDPTAFRVPGFERTRFAMPAYTGMSDEDLTALVAMLAANRGNH
jgi:nitric oxide reductase subunit C